jgi:hypothetical protein
MLPVSIGRDAWLDGVQSGRPRGPAAVNDWQNRTCGAHAAVRARRNVGSPATLFGPPGVLRRSFLTISWTPGSRSCDN